MTSNDREEMEIELMNAQIEALRAERDKHEIEREKLRTETERFRQELKWETWKALTTIVGGLLVGIAAMTGAVLALASWLSQHPHGL
jgi:hypothetical protein